jgi:hypothetical protein
MEKKIAIVFQEPTGLWHFCDDALGFLDARGRGYRFVSDAAAWAELDGFTHYKRSGRVRKIGCGKDDHTNVWGGWGQPR